MNTALTESLSIRYPIIQAPIGTCSGPELASAVSNAGALGSMAIWTYTPESVARLVGEAAALTARPFSVNIRADLNQHEHLRAALGMGARVIHLFWGDPAPYVQQIRAAAAKLMCTVASEDEAKQALDAGADVLIAQGWEAGGHVRGTTSTIALVPTVVDLAGAVPVVAAGGISDGRGLAAALMLGAAGVLMGTRFVASDESRAHSDYKSALVSAKHTDTAIAVDLFDIGWEDAPHRVLRNSTFLQWEQAGSPKRGLRPGEGDTIATRSNGRGMERYAAAPPLAGMTGQIEAMAMYAGQGVQGIRGVLSAASIVERTIEQAAVALARYAA